MTLYDAIGLLGVAIILISYFLLQVGKLHLEQVLYSLANLIGALLILLSLFFSWKLASFIIEIASNWQ